MIVVNAAAVRNGLVICIAVGDGQLRNGDNLTRRDVEYAIGRVSIYSQNVSPGTGDSNTFVDQQFVARQPNRAGHFEVDRVAIVGYHQRLTQRAGTLVIRADDGNNVRVSGQVHYATKRPANPTARLEPSG